ncbi:MAG: hypothetical protein ATN31_03720 [Candidatus Epulonipiscioides saccharophilum]|nr:MAG: hypothetical protein ATN31_03720 [Epulopiscium sp. AS2M-Bin001]
MEYIKLSNGIKMPKFGLGTYLSKGEEGIEAIKEAIKLGYPMIDTARVYKNEQEIREALEITGIQRENIWITSKAWTKDFGDIRAEVVRALEAMGVKYFNLYLLHWPKTYVENADAWKQMEQIYEEGLVRAIGVSNFQIHHLDRLLKTAKIKPMINQVEAHPNLPQYNLQEYCEQFNCHLEAYGSFMNNEGKDMPELVEIAQKHDCSIYDVTLAWLMQRGIAVIPKSVTKSRIASNMNALNIKLDDEDMELIKRCNQAKRYYPCPDNHSF